MSHPERLDELKTRLRNTIENSVSVEIQRADQQIKKLQSQLVLLQQRQDSLIKDRDKTIEARLSALERTVEHHHQQLAAIPDDVKATIAMAQESARRLATEGKDVSAVPKVLNQIGIKIREGRIEEVRALLQRLTAELNKHK